MAKAGQKRVLSMVKEEDQLPDLANLIKTQEGVGSHKGQVYIAVESCDWEWECADGAVTIWVDEYVANALLRVIEVDERFIAPNIGSRRLVGFTVLAALVVQDGRHFFRFSRAEFRDCLPSK